MRKCKIGIVGFGTVGSGIYKILSSEVDSHPILKEIEITKKEIMLVDMKIKATLNEFIKTKFFSLSSLITQGIYLNKSDTEVELDILLIASPIRPEIDRTSMFLAPLTRFMLSIVSVITKFLITDFFIFFTASPLSTP